MLVQSQRPAANRVLAALSPDSQKRMHLTPIKLALGRVLYEPGATTRHIYFPDDCLISLLAVLESGSRGLEVGMVGKEGMVGIPVGLGAGTSPVRALVQGAGTAQRMTAARFRAELKRSPPLRRKLSHGAYVSMATAMRIAACNKSHLLEARLARWLLMMGDRLASCTFRVTQVVLAQMLGVRRAGVTAAASGLQRRKLISYSRGNIRILDLKGLRVASCSCYQVIRELERPGA
jgi:CRP-like cAMP-binding protein